MAVERTQVGEGFAGAGAETAHVNTILGHKGGPVETAWATALATPRVGHIPFVAVLRPNVPVKPMTLFVNKAPIDSERHGTLTWGAAQAGVASGVASSLRDGIIEAVDADGSLLIVAVWVDPAADDEAAVFVNNRQATRLALIQGASGLPALDQIVAEADRPSNPYLSIDVSLLGLR